MYGEQANRATRYCPFGDNLRYLSLILKSAVMIGYKSENSRREDVRKNNKKEITMDYGRAIWHFITAINSGDPNYCRI